jgi:hypothetical protein
VVCVVKYLSRVWDWLHDHDLPNWIAAFAWPLLIWWWSTRRVNSVLGLAVHFAPGSVTIGPNSHPVVNVHFINYTGCVVYITGMWVQPNLKTFNMPADAGRDAARGKYLVAFLEGNELKGRERTLQSNDRTAVAAFALEQEMPTEFYKYRAPLWRRVLRRPKYFRFEYVVMIDTKRRLVAMIH